MPIAIEISRAAYNSFADALDEAGIDYELTEQRHFDGFFEMATFAVETVGTLGGIIVPLIVAFTRRNPAAEVKIDGITVSGLSTQQLRDLIDASGRSER
jgi:hypothetical protein